MHVVIARPDHGQLFAVAEGQAGHFTTAQAVAAGFARSTHTYHVRAGNWLRVHRGIYRLRRFPAGEHDQLVLWALWSRGADGEPLGVYSHATALALRDLSDINPGKLHMTVPPSFRRNSATPAPLVLHKAALAPSETVAGPGFRMTTVARAVIDLAESGMADRGLIAQALREARRRGMLTKAEVKAALAGRDVPGWLRNLLEQP